MSKPAFDPTKPFEAIDKPPFNPKADFEVISESILKKYEKKEETQDQKILRLVQEELGKIKIPPKVIEKVIEKTEVVKEVTKKDDRKLVEEKSLNALKDQIKKLQEIVEEQQKIIQFDIANRGGSGIIGIPNPEGNNGKVLTAVGNQAKWQPSTGGTSSAVYTTSNVTTTRTLDPTTSSIDNLYNVVASLIVDLQGAGILQ